MTKLAIYALLGILTASITAAFEPAWWVTLLAFWAGACLGLLIALSAAVFDRLTKGRT